MLFMGNGDASAAVCHERIVHLIRLHEELSGVQQMGIGPLARDNSIEMEELQEEVVCYLKAVGRDFRLQVKARSWPKTKKSPKRHSKISDSKRYR
jgi:hypothetical protein